MKSNYFASCPRGLEALLVKELEALKIESSNQVDGGVEFSCSMEQMYRANITSRVATRIMMRIKKGTYETEDDLYQAALEINWFDYFDISNSIKVSIAIVATTIVASAITSVVATYVIADGVTTTVAIASTTNVASIIASVVVTSVITGGITTTAVAIVSNFFGHALVV